MKGFLAQLGQCMPHKKMKSGKCGTPSFLFKILFFYLRESEQERAGARGRAEAEEEADSLWSREHDWSSILGLKNHDLS